MTRTSPSKSILPLWIDVHATLDRPVIDLGRTNDYESTYIYFDELPNLISALNELLKLRP